MTEDDQREDTDDNTDDNGDYETEGIRLYAVDQVHTEERGYQRGQHENDGHTCQRTHEGVHVVVDNRLVGIHRRLQNVGIDAGGFASLSHLDVDVFDEVGVQFVNLQLELQLRQQYLVTTNGGVEVRQRVLQA